ncbi:protein NO VEIN domain-containing protein [Actinoplanes sp. M2I2]|uniref:protein NO VEIN domain-containing protein n=1 Tax=Actinoplanes sp. M2I2 TaxID=1734444 RepID=UPI0020222F85|nr:DUF3883 domain-containing protein [Actinoplanes sp. M2I2]
MPGSADHVALDSDGLGYDIELSAGPAVWHVEVKSTKRRGRLDVYLSRHEFEVARLDPAWRLVTVGLDEDGHIGAIATVPTDALLVQAPADRATTARWESAKFSLRPTDLRPGIPFFDLDVSVANSRRFAWMPLS